jgi:hypothetical protein
MSSNTPQHETYGGRRPRRQFLGPMYGGYASWGGFHSVPLRCRPVSSFPCSTCVRSGKGRRVPSKSRGRTLTWLLVSVPTGVRLSADRILCRTSATRDSCSSGSPPRVRPPIAKIVPHRLVQRKNAVDRPSATLTGDRWLKSVPVMSQHVDHFRVHRRSLFRYAPEALLPRIHTTRSCNYWPTFTPPQWPGFTPPLTASFLVPFPAPFAPVSLTETGTQKAGADH